MPDPKTVTTRIVVTEDVVRLAADDPEEVSYSAAAAVGISWVAAVILWTLSVGSVGFLFGAAWRGSQIVGH